METMGTTLDSKKKETKDKGTIIILGMITVGQISTNIGQKIFEKNHIPKNTVGQIMTQTHRR